MIKKPIQRDMGHIQVAFEDDKTGERFRGWARVLCTFRSGMILLIVPDGWDRQILIAESDTRWNQKRGMAR